MEPTGSSALDTNVLANVSAINKKNAPKKMEKIKTCLLLFPHNNLTIWGMIKPINPITPEMETTAAISNEETKREANVTN